MKSCHEPKRGIALCSFLLGSLNAKLNRKFRKVGVNFCKDFVPGNWGHDDQFANRVALEDAFEIGEMCAPLYPTRDFAVFRT
jgi:hypothetical protein